MKKYKEGDFMYQKRKKYKKRNTVLMIVIVVFLLLSSSYFILRKKKHLTPIEATLKDAGLALEKILLKPFQLSKEKITNTNIESLEKQANSSEALKAKNRELEHQLSELKKTLKLNTVLSERVYLNATVINRNMDYWYQTITLDKGEHNGVEANMPVVVTEGLVGMTSQISNFNSTIQLLTSDELPHKISVKIEIDGHFVYGLLTGYNHKNKTLQIEGIASNQEIPVGSVVTTTGLGDDMPAGIIVGYVKNITMDHFELSRLVEIESKVPFDHLQYVTILKRKEQ